MYIDLGKEYIAVTRGVDIESSEPRPNPTRPTSRPDPRTSMCVSTASVTGVNEGLQMDAGKFFMFYLTLFLTTMSDVNEGLQMDAGKFFVFYLTLFLTTMSGAGVCLMVSATVRAYALASLLAVFIFVLMLVRISTHIILY